jgi:protein SCO1
MKKILIPALIILLFSGCSEKFELNQKVTGTNATLLNQDSTSVNYPDLIKNKIAVIGFIYTHCPDICPLTTHNMQLAEEQLSNDEMKDIKFILVSFDPERDTPSILQQYASVRDMNMKHWEMLTGNKNDIDSILNIFDVKAIHDDSTYNSKGELSYFIIHTDRISLVDKSGNLRKNFRGSTTKPEDLVNDIRNLE